MVKEGTAVNIYAVDFTGVLCWIIIYSETDSIASFGPGDYFIFIGLPDSDNLSPMGGVVRRDGYMSQISKKA